MAAALTEQWPAQTWETTHLGGHRFAATLLAMITNGVLSPQFLMWIVGVGAVCMGTRGSQMLRPALIVAAAVILTFGLYQSPAILVLRNTLLVVACVDATWKCFDALRRARPTNRPRSPNPM